MEEAHTEAAVSNEWWAGRKPEDSKRDEQASAVWPNKLYLAALSSDQASAYFREVAKYYRLGFSFKAADRAEVAAKTPIGSV